MNLAKIIEEMQTERQNLDDAISALVKLAQSRRNHRGRPPAWLKSASKTKRGRPPGPRIS
ncbi:MAG: hypothetical protein ACR2I2_11380 [Bryobacteraceae bacterium]